MSVTLEQLGRLFEKMAPQRFAETWDNTGFNVNLHNEDIRGIYVCLDVTPESILEASEKECGLIISHHPLFFHAVKSIDNASYEGKCAQLLLQHGISLYCSHTSFDLAPAGINGWLADVFKLENRCCLSDAVREPFYEIAVHVPRSHADAIKKAMTDAGAGKLGAYSGCTYSVEGKGTFIPDENAQPYLGTANIPEVVDEMRISSICGKAVLGAVLSAVRKVHPYEEPAISVLILEEPERIEAGLGVVGDLPQELTVRRAVERLKMALAIDSVRVTGNLDRTIKRLAVCGGAAGDLAEQAEKLGAQLYITGEIKHNYYVARKNIVLVEAGHFDTEKCFCELYAQGLQSLLDDVNYNIAIYVEDLRRPYVNY